MNDEGADLYFVHFSFICLTRAYVFPSSLEFTVEIKTRVNLDATWLWH